MKRFGGWAGSLLRIPLAWKLAGANLLIALAALGADTTGHRLTGDASWTPLIMGVTITAALVINFALVGIALQPLRELETTVARVSRGEFGARVPTSALSDRDMTRVGTMFNLLLDSLSEDRIRLQQMTSQVIDEGDRQRAAIAHELHDSTAQTLSALVMQLAVAAREETNPDRSTRLAALRDMIASVTEEIRQLAHDVHPRVLEDLGLPAALRDMARELGTDSGVAIDVFAPWDTPEIPVQTSIPFYRIVREALTNSLRHANPCRVIIRLSVDEDRVSVTVDDDGSGFDVARAEAQRGARGIFAMRERAALANGTLAIRSSHGRGTTVSINAPMFTGSKPGLAGAVT
jgi:signal transduction histidine kinase